VEKQIVGIVVSLEAVALFADETAAVLPTSAVVTLMVRADSAVGVEFTYSRTLACVRKYLVVWRFDRHN
jgi:hypothetical protein